MSLASDHATKEYRKHQKIFIEQLNMKPVGDIFREYRKICKMTKKVEGREIGQLHALYGEKVRFSNITCVEATRIALKNRPKSANFIHANKVSINESETQFICAQAPYEDDVQDFWHMVFSEDVGSIVMLCLVVEGGEKKSGQYWPILGIHDVGDYLVTTHETDCKKYYAEPPEEVVVSFIEVKKKTTNETKKVVHYQYKNWVDHGVPRDAQTLAKLVAMMQKLELNGKKSVVHCAAGVGRTGTFVAANIIYEKFKKNEPIDVVKVVTDLRKSRNKAIQGEAQYLFMYLLVVELIERDGKHNVQNLKGKLLEEHERHRLRS